MLNRIVLQEYTQAETASLLGMNVRTVCYRFPQAVDRLTEKLFRSQTYCSTALIPFGRVAKGSAWSVPLFLLRADHNAVLEQG